MTSGAQMWGALKIFMEMTSYTTTRVRGIISHMKILPDHSLTLSRPLVKVASFIEKPFLS
jgi:hypothetical protein